MRYFIAGFCFLAPPGTRGFLVMYAETSLAEQQTPAALAISDVGLSVQNLLARSVEGSHPVKSYLWK